MTVYYLDSSAWVKRYVEEAGHEVVNQLLLSDSPVTCSVLGRVETAAALTRRNRSTPDAGALTFALADLDDVWKRCTRIELDDDLGEHAKRLAVAFGLRGADAVHLASAVFLARTLEGSSGLRFVCSDRELNEAALTVGLTVIDPATVG